MFFRVRLSVMSHDVVLTMFSCFKTAVGVRDVAASVYLPKASCCFCSETKSTFTPASPVGFMNVLVRFITYWREAPFVGSLGVPQAPAIPGIWQGTAANAAAGPGLAATK